MFSLLLELFASVITLQAQTSTIYVLSLRGGKAITGYKADGAPLPLRIGEGACNCTGIALNQAGQIIESSNTTTNQLQLFNPDGTAGKPIVHLGAAFFGVAASDDGRLFVISSGEKGEVVVNILLPGGMPASPSFRTQQSAAKIGLSHDGKKIYVSSADYNNVKIFDPHGNLIGKPFGAGINVPRGVAVSRDGKIYVANEINVTTYDADGKKLPIEMKHDHDGVPYLPLSIAVDAEGTVYVGYQSGVVGVFNPDGSFVRMLKTPVQVVGVTVH